MAWALYFLASAAKSIGAAVEASSYCEQSEALFDSIDDAAGKAHIQQEHAEVLLQLSQLSQARSLFSRSLGSLEAMRDLNCAIASVTGIALVDCRETRYSDALRGFDDALTRCATLDHQAGVAWVLECLVELVVECELWHEAAFMLDAADGLRQRASSPAAPYAQRTLLPTRRRVSEAIGHRGRKASAASFDDFDLVVEHVRSVLPYVGTLLESKGSAPDGDVTERRWVTASDAGSLLTHVDDYRSRKAEILLASALEDAGWSLHRVDQERAAEFLLEAIAIYEDFGVDHDVGRSTRKLREVGVRRGVRGKRGRPATGWEALTPAESRVAELVAGGLSNVQVAERLFISRRTVDAHLSHIFDKLNISSRVELARESARRRS